MAWWIFQNVVVTAALALAVAMVCRISVFRIGPVARHALWLLVLVKFVTPPLVVWPWAAPDPLGLAALDVRVDEHAAARPSHDVLVTESSVSPPSEVLVLPIAADSGGAANGDSVPRPAAVAAVAWPWLLGAWAAGSLVLLGLEIVRLLRMTRRIRTARPTEPAIVSRVAALSARMGLKPVPVVTIAGHASPAIWGFGRTRLLWPADLPADSSDACLDGLLVHELAHVKRRDHLVGWIELTAGIVWWWNPLFWFVRSARREQAELACDAWVISALPNGRRAYAESLLALSGAAVRGAPSMALLGIRATSRRILERRLVMIMKGRAPLRLPWVGLVSLALIAAATLPAWATSQQTPPPPPPPPVVAVRPPSTPPPSTPLPPAVAVTPPSTPPPPAVAVRPPSTPPSPAPAVPQKTAPATPSKVAPSAVPAPTAAPRGQRAQTPAPGPWKLAFGRDLSAMPADGQELVKGFETQREAIQKEADQKIAASQEALTKALQDLQDKYAKAGKLDEAVAIRDYLRAGGPGGWSSFRFVPSGRGGYMIRR